MLESLSIPVSLPPEVATNPDVIRASSEIFRQGTDISRTKIALVFNSGGIGDYINWTPAIKYVIDRNPHIHGYIVSPHYFADLAFLWFEGYSDRFKVIIAPDFSMDARLKDVPCITPNPHQFVSASGFHLFELGYFYYNQHRTIPKEPRYSLIPEIRGDETSLAEFNLPERYAVLTVEATHDVRRIPSAVINDISRFLLAEGITPVILGKRFLAEGYSGTSNDGLDVSGGVLDLRERTILREAACIMAKAQFTFGLDNGLLHLASCSTAPVISYFTSVDPQLRIPPRRFGAKTIAITPAPQLSCRFCNSQMRYIIGHDFKYCLYKDNLCVTSIKSSDIIGVIKDLLSGEGPPSLKSVK